MRQYDIYTNLSKKLNLPVDTIKHLCGCEFRFILDCVNDESDDKDLLLKGLFRLKRKKRYCKNNEAHTTTD